MIELAATLLENDLEYPASQESSVQELAATMSTDEVKMEGSLATSIEVGGGTRDYNKLFNQPSIEGHTLKDNSTLDDIGVTQAIDTKIGNVAIILSTI